MLTRALLTLLLANILAGCSTLPSPGERRIHADKLAAAHGWTAEVIAAGTFDLVAYAPTDFKKERSLTIYIEGDGFAWISPSRPSSDPTPLTPLALQLALAQPPGNAVYLARPCQYVDAKHSGCSQRYWTEARFAPEVAQSTVRAIDQLKQRFGAKQLTLVGYSGGGAVAALVAARRDDVTGLITVAGNLDHRAWTVQHRIDSLSDSLNPADETNRLTNIKQWHFVGGRDSNVSPGLTQSYADLYAAHQRPRVIVEPNFDHQCCWVKAWPRLWSNAAP